MVKSLARSAALCLTAILVAVPVFGAEVFPYVTPADGDAAARAAAQEALYSRLSVLEGNAGAFDVLVPRADLDALRAHVPQGGPLWVGIPGDIGFTFDAGRKSQAIGSTVVSEGTTVWTAAFRSAGATGVRLQLERVNLPEGAELYAFDRYGQAFGPYTDNGRGSLWTNTAAGDEIVLQLHLPMQGGWPAARGELFQVSQLSHLGDRYSFGAGPGGRAFCAWNDGTERPVSCDTGLFFGRLGRSQY